MPSESRVSGKRERTKRLLLVIVIVAILVGAVIFFVFLNKYPNWVSIASWSGQETEYTMTTEPFTINGTEWHVNWQVAGYDNSSRCYISIYDADTDEFIVELPRDQSGMAHFNTKGTFCLKIETHGALKSWSVQVYQTP